MEGQNAIKHGKKIDLSEQELIDCSASFGNGGCNGGYMDASYKYVQANGIASYSAYPYSGSKKVCSKSTKARTNVKVTGFKHIDASESALQAAVGE